MRLSYNVIVALAAVCRASPLLYPAANLPVLSARDTQNVTTFNASLPNITIFATGGTIAGSASSNTQTTGYQAGALGIQTLIDAVPSILNISNVFGVQVANVDSDNITPAITVNLTHQINAALKSPYVQGVVVTHGTDTLEETAFLLSLTIDFPKPVVIVGAMRPATAISADGPINLLAAVTLAASPDAQHRGVMIVLNDRIQSAHYTTKTNANSLDTFKAVEQGNLGYFDNIQPKFYYSPATPTGRHFFSIDNGTVLPEVSILYGYQGLDPQLITQAVAGGAQGVVLAGMGAGGWTSLGAVTIAEVASNGTYVVVSHRSQDGVVSARGPPKEGVPITIGSGILNPQKSRILLQLCIEAGLSAEETQAVFEF